ESYDDSAARRLHPAREACRCCIGEIQPFADRASMDVKIDRRTPVEPEHSMKRSNLARKLRNWRIRVVDRRASTSIYPQETLRHSGSDCSRYLRSIPYVGGGSPKPDPLVTIER